LLDGRDVNTDGLMTATPIEWAAFLAIIFAMLALDLGVFHRHAHEVGVRSALGWTAAWIAVATAFGGWVTWRFGTTAGVEFATGYLLEKALSVDNVFVIMVLLQSFAVPKAQQHRVLFWGVLGALVLRGLFIGVGSALVAAFHPVLWVFGGILVFTAVKLVWPAREVVDALPAPAPPRRLTGWLTRLVPVSTSASPSDHFVVREAGRWVGTPLLLALLSIEGADLLFAVDSIPAVFAVTQNPFLVFTSNILAMLGLRSLFFVLAGAAERFHLLKFGLAAVLLFVGCKLLLTDVVHVPIGLSLGLIGAALSVSVVASLVWPARVRAL
jgi:tellurite resistance protein TerC